MLQRSTSPGGITDLLLAHVPAAVAMFDCDMRFLAISRRGQIDYGLENRDVIGLSYYEVFSRVSDNWRAAHKRALQGETVHGDEDTFTRDDGRIEWVKWEMVPWRNDRGEIGGITLFTQLITKQVETNQTLAQMRRALEDRRRLLDTAFESMDEALCIGDADGNIVRFNTAFARLHRFSCKDECLNQFAPYADLFELHYPDGTPLSRADWGVSRALRGESETGQEIHVRRKDTGESWVVSINFTPIRDGQNKIIGSVVISREITAEKQARQALERIAARNATLAEELDLLIDGAHDYAIYMLDREGRVTIWNDGAARLTGWHENEVIGSDLSIFYTPQDRDAGLAHADLQLVTTGGTMSRDSIHLRKDGSKFIAHRSVTPLYGQDGMLRGYSVVVHDVTDQREAERRLIAHASHLRSILATVPDAMLVTDDLGQIVSFSKAAEKLFGFTETEMIGQPAQILLAPADRKDYVAHVQTLRETKLEQLMMAGAPLTGLTRNGTTFPMKLFTGIATIDGRPIYTGFIRDLTECLQNEARLEELRAELIHVARVSAMGTMASTLAHELNQPITAMKNYVEGIACLIDNPDDELRSALTHASAEATRAGEIVRHLREFVANGEVQSTFENPASLIKEALALGSIGTREAGIEMIVQHDPAVDLVLVDRVQTQQVLINLVRNAAEALVNLPTRRITISTAVESDQLARISVADTGKGIAPAMAATLFHAFKSTKSQGMGLGLSICRTIVEANGGRIWHEKNSDGGATFHFTLIRGNMGEAQHG